jgi:ArsR family transcriptional regulator
LTPIVFAPIVNGDSGAHPPRPPAPHEVRPIMEKKLYELQAELCKTLSNPKRLEILDILREEGEISVNRLAERLEIPKANTSQHLAVLRQAGVVATRKDGINVYYSLRSTKISEACSLTRAILLEKLEDQAGLSTLIRRDVDA